MEWQVFRSYNTCNPICVLFEDAVHVHRQKAMTTNVCKPEIDIHLFHDILRSSWFEYDTALSAVVYARLSTTAVQYLVLTLG